MRKSLRILGIRGIPANHGGFETFAEHLSMYLVKRGWEVTVYCQEEGTGVAYQNYWNGIRLIHIPVRHAGSLGSVIFDWKSTLHAAKDPGLILTLGYNTGIFCAWYRICGITNLINMDGIEWRRQKWGLGAKAWFYFNERAAAWLGNHLIADHPDIKAHLASRISAKKITTIAYGSNQVRSANAGFLANFGLEPLRYAIVIGRPEPENSVLEVVKGWSRKKRGMPLVVLGNYLSSNQYHCAIKNAASEEVIFPGAIYDTETVSALRYFARFYIHGHQVGGTNPSLVEAMGAGNAILAHNNRFNRWVAGDAAKYFNGESDFEEVLERILTDEIGVRSMQAASIRRHQEAFTWEKILRQYEDFLSMHSSGTSPQLESEADGWNAAKQTAPVPDELAGQQGNSERASNKSERTNP